MRNKRIGLPGAFLTFFLANQASGSVNLGDLSIGTELKVSSVNLSEPVTIKANFDDWETDELKPGNRLYSKQVAKAGFTINRVHMGYTKQLYYYLNFSDDTARLHYLERNDILQKEKSTFDLYLKANNAEAEGFYLGYTLEWNGLRINTTLNYLDIEELYYGEAFGFFDPAETPNNSTHITIDYAYPEDRIFDRYVEPPEGTGITVDVEVHYSWREHAFTAVIGEAYSDFYWNTAPGSRIEGNLNSLLSGSEAAVRYSHFRTRFHQRLPVHTDLQYRYRINSDFSAGLNYERLDRKSWTKWVGNWHITPKWTGSVLWSPSDSIWGLEIQHPYLVFGLESDSSDYRKSHYLKFELSARAVFF